MYVLVALASSSTTLGNTYLGLTTYVFSAGRLTTRLQVNYVLAAGDPQSYSGISGYRDNTFLLQLQIEAHKLTGAERVSAPALVPAVP